MDNLIGTGAQQMRAGNQLIDSKGRDLCAQSAVCCGQRQSGKGALQDIIVRRRRKAENLQVIVDMLPGQPTPEQDQHLWELAQDLAG